MEKSAMFEELKGKRLLIIGSDNSDREIVRAAKEHGIYTIAVDGVPKSLKTLAKNMADEAWDIDYSQTDTIAEEARKAGVDGVFAGYSEMRVLAAIHIAEALNLPFYATKEIMDLTRNKRSFKEICTEYGVSVPAYFCVSSMPSKDDIRDISFPVIVKPTDAAGRKGLHVCYTAEELLPAIETALKHSLSHEVIIEEYITGTEFTALYTIADGKPSLSLMKDKYLVEAVRNACLSNFSIAPSRALDSYLEQMNPSVCRMLTGIGAVCGVATLQGMYNSSGFYAFEMNYRIGDGNDHLLINQENGTNYMDMMLHYALTGKPGISLEKDDPHFQHYCSRLQIHLKPGIVGKMSYPAVGDIPGIVAVTQHKVPGMVVPKELTTAHRALSIFMMADTVGQMCETVQNVQRSIAIEDTEGNNMMYPYFDTGLLEPRT
ncbi:MAG: ATP-grasp domain-containing protein [Erysipelotrichaceae bacterium]|nr:ATP-grasp domain-containing protein [Erysipelotrichaceae bacterium]